ncbi:13288_t:CDS:2 [Dentiscutata erythropus]|uniref:13288_t:CDS:1 n=1 Tax=Dentiscutata erythropus TaxID=1348616 RepID=A0A9N8W0R1_9GLOM|nr:13288_t:CDS:2 [Dentiscutata erythropus]
MEDNDMFEITDDRVNIRDLTCKYLTKEFKELEFKELDKKRTRYRYKA